MNIEQLKNQLRKYRLSPNFTYGQNFLMDEIVLQDIVDAAGVGDGDCVLEIGPGLGSLTRLLCERAKLVLSIEKDPKFLPVLKSIKKDCKNFRYEIADALDYDFQKYFQDYNCTGRQVNSAADTSLERGDRSEAMSEGGNPSGGLPLRGSYMVVANIPYYITGKIIQMLVTAKFKPKLITLLTQKEVAQNIVARPGGMSILAISVQLFGEPKIIRTVPARSFYPAPKVDSAVLQIKLFDRPRYQISDEKNFFRIVKACFAGKRKQLHNTLKNNLHLDKDAIDKILAELKIKPTARPQELAIEQWVELNKLITGHQ
jgi:16S rRNA (adenine1518-N6/adenine1519-N6)-dimethyltransferase